MALWLVMETFNGFFDGSMWNLRSGGIIDDEQVPVSALRAMGLAVTPYVAAMSATVDAYNQQHVRDDAPPSMAPVLKSFGMIPHVEAVTITAADIIAGTRDVVFPFDVSAFMVSVTSAGALKFAGTDTFVAADATITITLPGGGGDLAADDVVTILAVG